MWLLKITISLRRYFLISQYYEILIDLPITIILFLAPSLTDMVYWYVFVFLFFFFYESLIIQSFWPFVSKFTHKDVVAQIKALSLINTEVGCCRVGTCSFYMLCFISSLTIKCIRSCVLPLVYKVGGVHVDPWFCSLWNPSIAHNYGTTGMVQFRWDCQQTVSFYTSTSIK